MWSKRQHSDQNGHNMAKRQKLPKIIKMGNNGQNSKIKWSI